MAELTDTYMHDVLGREVGGSGWQLSELMGTMGKTRLARRGDEAVAVKLVDTPPAVMVRLSEIGVTPPVVAMGTHDGRHYLIQQAVNGPHPDHAWFAANVATWAETVRCYLDDLPLQRMLAASPGFWRLTVSDAVAMIDDQPAQPRGGALREPAFLAAFGHWRRQADSIAGLPLRPIHPDAHWHNYVIADGHPYLLDWEYVDLSDPLRDVGIQVWGFLPKSQWAEFLRRVGIARTEDVEIAIHWWAALKMLMNALFNDGRGNEQGAKFHADAFRTAVEQRPWVTA